MTANVAFYHYFPGNNQVRAPLMTGNVRPPAPANQRPQFPNPIQRPGGPPVSGHRQTNMQHFNNNSGIKANQSQSGQMQNNAGPLNLGAMNMGGSNMLSNMLLNAAKSVLTQACAGPNTGNSNHYGGPMKGPGPAPGAYQGPGRNEGPRSGPPMNKGSMGPNGQSYPMGNSHHSGSSGNAPSHGTQKPAPGSYPGPTNTLKAQQAQQRQALLSHAKNFLSQGNNKADNKTSSVSASSSTTGEKKPALAMVSNPSLVGTSVKINLSASSNTRAPAMTTTSPAASAGSTTSQTDTTTVTVTTTTSSVSTSSTTAEK